MYNRLMKAVFARQGIDIDDKRDKFTIEKEIEESKQMIRDCYREERLRKKKEEQQKNVRI